ncbi:MAG: LysM peptidoglycan-binding domain-containing M23 family metallopeptidase [Proteobacteria bacterium]|nr:LysM peptidoglycan-binding domain-containing M23 family metallopeptidase [Pseudomonadota bacterium]
MTLFQVQVEEGDTLNSIAHQFDTDWRDIVRLNKSTLKQGLRVGQVLNVLPGKEAVTAVRVSHRSDSPEDIFDDQDDEDIHFSAKNRGLLFGGNKSKEDMDFVFPLEGRVTSHFGKRGRRLHKGIDLSANVGTSIMATSDGEVVFSGKRKGYGGTVVIDHGSFVSLYAHCSRMIAKVGDTVAQGDFIAKSGRTGNARGAHLHFEIRDVNNKPIDPEPLLRHRTLARNKGKSQLPGMPLAKGQRKSKQGLLYASKPR